jgi:transposase
MNDARDVFVAKHHHRIDSYIQQATAWTARYAERRRVASVHLDTSDRSYLVEWPWHRLVEMLRWKLSARGIDLVHVGASDGVVDTESATARDV